MATVKEVRPIIVELSRNGHGTPEIARRLNAQGMTNSQGRPWNHQRVSQILYREVGERRALHDLERCRRGFKRALGTLMQDATHDPRSRRAVRVLLKEQDAGADVLSAAERAIAAVA